MLHKTKMNDKISVIIPAYNAADTIARAIDSVLRQTCPPAEILVVDDGSTDATASIVAQYSAPVRLLQKPNGGPGSARNLGAREASGTWLALLDADDSWLPRKLETQIPFAHFAETGVIFYPRRSLPTDYLPGNLAFTTLWEKNFVLASSVLMRRAAFEAVGGFNEDRELIGVEDYNLWLRLAFANWAFARCVDLTTYYTPSPNNLSSQSIRMLNAGLYNIRILSQLLELSDADMQTKRLHLLEQFSRTLFYKRDMLAARHALTLLCKEQVSFFAASRWLATFLPSQCWGHRRGRTQRLHDMQRRIERDDSSNAETVPINEIGTM